MDIVKQIKDDLYEKYKEETKSDFEDTLSAYGFDLSMEKDGNGYIAVVVGMTNGYEFEERHHMKSDCIEDFIKVIASYLSLYSAKAIACECDDNLEVAGNHLNYMNLMLEELEGMFNDKMCSKIPMLNEYFGKEEPDKDKGQIEK